jgi:hypothetical protein
MLFHDAKHYLLMRANGASASAARAFARDMKKLTVHGTDQNY